MQMRTGNFWYSTRDSAIAVLALTDYVKKTRELGTTFDVLVKVNGRDTRHLHFSPTSVFNPDEKLEVPLTDLQEGHNTVQLLVTGGGRAYYSLDLRQVVQEDQIAASQNAGLMVSRSYYLLEPRRMEDGSQKLVTSRQPVDRVNAGDLVRVQVSLVSTKPFEFLMVEDPIPSNCRVTDREYVENAWDWTYWWSQLVIRDDKVAFFVRDLPVGLHKLEYTMRAEQTGRVTSLPVTVENMYDPTIRSNGASALFEVQR